MRRFRYGFDPLCLAAGAAYALNRWILPLSWKGEFLRGHFADLLLIPAALPLMLWVHRRCGLRASDGPPRWAEIFFHATVWSVAAELVGPHLFARATGDPLDVAAYVTGALAAGLCWMEA